MDGKLFDRERNPEDGIVGEILANYLTEKEMQNNCQPKNNFHENFKEKDSDFCVLFLYDFTS